MQELAYFIKILGIKMYCFRGYMTLIGLLVLIIWGENYVTLAAIPFNI